MRKMTLHVIAILLVLLSISCEQAPSLSFEDIQGEWDFPDGSHISVVDRTIIDISWEEGEDDYFAFVDGSLDDNIFSGTYGHNSTVGGLSVSESDLSITITLTLSDNKLSATCSGEGPLHGKTFSTGTEVFY